MLQYFLNAPLGVPRSDSLSTGADLFPHEFWMAPVAVTFIEDLFDYGAVFPGGISVREGQQISRALEAANFQLSELFVASSKKSSRLLQLKKLEWTC